MAPAAGGKSERGAIMTREEAIKILAHYVDNECYTPRYKESHRMAISALQEKEDRERGCEYCNDCESIYHCSSEINDSMDEDVYISGNCIIVDIGCHSYGLVKINFCPMCGRRLYLPKPTTTEANN